MGENECQWNGMKAWDEGNTKHARTCTSPTTVVEAIFFCVVYKATLHYSDRSHSLLLSLHSLCLTYTTDTPLLLTHLRAVFMCASTSDTNAFIISTSTASKVNVPVREQVSARAVCE